MFEWAGVSFGEEETYKLSKAIKVTKHSFIIMFLEISRIEWSNIIEILG